MKFILEYKLNQDNKVTTYEIFSDNTGKEINRKIIGTKNLDHYPKWFQDTLILQELISSTNK